jgi:hypothetical protein
MSPTESTPRDSLERQVERMRARLDRPSSLLDRGSPSNSPRKA